MIYDVLDSKDEKSYYEDAKEAFIDFLAELQKDEAREAIYHAQKNIIPLIKTKESARFFLDMLVEGFEDILNIKQGKSPFLKSYDTILQALSVKLSHIDESLIELLKCGDLINLNVNIPLLIEHIFHTITKED